MVCDFRWFSLSFLVMAACSGASSSTEEEEELVAAVFPDEDGDTIMDHHEGSPEARDSDGDDQPDYLDEDSDGDGIADALEAGDDDVLTFPIDTDLDGTSDVLDLDSDDNCLPDADEGAHDSDGDGVGDYNDLDNDGDQIGDTYEIGDSAACAPPDTDGDGQPDYLDIDSDGDGIGDLFEGGTTPFDPEPVDTDRDGLPDYLDLDSDGDGLDDATESGVTGPDQEPLDTDGDGFYNFADLDSDNDGLSDRDEVLLYDTDPYNYDSDDDGFNDGAEVASGSDPADGNSRIEGIYVEVPERSDVEEVFEFELSIQRGDVAFLLDTTCSMGSTLTAMRNEYSAIVSQLATVLPDAAYAVGTFDDYNFGGMGGGADKPFILVQQMTNDLGRVQSALSGIPLHNGSDLPESTTEAVLQSLTGRGYDQNCNRSFDAGTDVRPYLAGPSDPFAGSAGQHYDPAVPGTGMGGGVGFRDYSLPVVVYATDAAMRDSSSYATPGGCPGDASGAETANAATAAGAYLIGISVNGGAAEPQMTALAHATSSYADIDGVGGADDPLVFRWSGSSGAFRDTIVQAVSDLVSSVRFNEVSLSIEGDTQGFVIDVQPRTVPVSGAVNGTVIDFTLTFRGTVAATGSDQLFKLTLNVVGDGSVLLDTLDIFVLVPGV